VKISVIAFGKLKTPGLREAADYYLKLIRSFQPSVQEIELKALSVPDKSAATRSLIQKKEGELLLDKLPPRAALFILDEAGKNLPTRDWAATFKRLEEDSVPEVVFCVGSSLGFAEDIRKKARGSLSLGSQTLPHELARVVLLEQIYRAQSVLKGHPYHNEGS
jgi:23S rRNA (pseudouridine1915-N3)-methyltransferase